MEIQTIHIAVCLDKDFVMPTGVMMYSACVNNQDVDIVFHVLIDESVTEEEQRDLKETINMFQGKKMLFYPTNCLSAIDFPLFSFTPLTTAPIIPVFPPPNTKLWPLLAIWHPNSYPFSLKLLLMFLLPAP